MLKNTLVILYNTNHDYGTECFYYMGMAIDVILRVVSNDWR